MFLCVAAALITTFGYTYACVGRFWQAVLIDAGPVGGKGEACRNERQKCRSFGVNSLISSVRSCLVLAPAVLDPHRWGWEPCRKV